MQSVPEPAAASPPWLVDGMARLFGDRYSAFRSLGGNASTAFALAHDHELGEEVVVRATRVAMLPLGMRLRLEHDATLLSGLRNEKLEPFVASGFDQETWLTISLRTQGVALQDILSHRRLSVSEALAVGKDLLEALREIHGKGILHHGVSPAMVQVDREDCVGAVTLLGCGSIIHGVLETLEESGAFEQAAFASPEQSGSMDHDLGPYSDLYSVGAVLFKCLAGRAPFSGATVGQILFAQMTAPAPELRSMGIDVPRALDEVLQRLLRKDPRSRYQSAVGVLADLELIAAALEHGQREPSAPMGARDVRGTITEPAFVARSQELREMQRALQSTAIGRGGLAILEADSGGGKSRFLDEIAQESRRDGYWVLRGEESSDIGRNPLKVFEGVIDGVIARAMCDPEFAEQLRESVAEQRSTLLAVFPQLKLILGEQENAALEPNAFAEARALAAVRALFSFLGGGNQPTIILLDDCQWSDDLSWKMLRTWHASLTEASEKLCRLLVVAAFRTEEFPADHMLRHAGPVAHVRLSALSYDDIRALAESMAGPLPTEVVDLVARFADGSPFMASAVLRGLVESGAMEPTAEGWHADAAKLQEAQSSSRAASILAQRIEMLDPGAIELLSIGAVLGKEFDLSLAAQLLGGVDSIAAIDEARQKRLVWVRPNQASCVFVHDKVRAALLEHLSDDQRRDIHRRAAGLLEVQSDARAADIAYHFDASGDPQSALPYAMQAAEQARSQHALENAEQQYEIAERGSAAEPAAVRRRILLGLGEVALLRGRYEQAAAVFTQATTFADERFDRAEVQSKLGDLAFKRGDMNQSFESYSSALRTMGVTVPRNSLVLLGLLGFQAFVQLLHTLVPKWFVHRRKRMPERDQRLVFDLLSGLAHSGWYVRGPAMVFWTHLKGLNRAEAYLPTPELAQAYSEHAAGMSMLGLFGRAEAYAERSLKMRKTLGDLWGQGQTLHYWGVVLYAASRFHQCIAKCRESVRLLERMGDYQQVHTAKYQIAASLYHLGEFSDAVAEAKSTHLSGTRLGDVQASGINLDVWARAAFGELPAGVLETELARERFDVQGTTQVLLASGVRLLAQDCNDEAADTLSRAAIGAWKAGVNNAYTVPVQAWLATARRRQAEQLGPYVGPKRHRVIKKALAAARSAIWGAVFCKNDLPRAYRELALVAVMRGRPRAARKAFRKSLVCARRQHARYEFAETLRAVGEAGSALGWARSSERKQRGQRAVDRIAMRVLVGREIGGEASLSLVDRFDTVLNSGRCIASALQEETIFAEARKAALHLLRGQACAVYRAPSADSPSALSLAAGEVPGGADFALMQHAIATKSAVVAGAEAPDANSAASEREGSALAVPIVVRGRTTACLYVAHRELDGLFGPDERRLADFVGCITGAALENAEGFQELETLNATLEQRVEERTEEVRVAMEVAESANRAKSRFLATMSHEIRTPMNGILGMTELAMHTRLSQQQAGYLGIVKQSGEALLTLLNDILDLSKIEAGKMELEDIPYDLPQTVSDAVRVMSAGASKKGIELICRVTPRVPQRLLGDPNRLRQCVVNLVGNAVKFTDKGEVAVEVELMPKLRGPHMLRFAVIDTGPGIPKEKQEHVFGAFQQCDSSTTRKYGGTGLGLSISAELIRLMGGRIWLESEVGKGTTFFFEIPLRVADQLDGRSAPTGELVDASILVISPNERAGRVYAELAQGFGAATEICRSFDEARLLFDAWSNGGKPPDTVLIDLCKSNPEFEQLVSRWDAELAERGLPLLCLTPPDWVDAQEYVHSPARLFKPPSPAELRSKLNQALAGSNDDERFNARTGAHTSLRILLADDSEVNQQVATGLLELRGHRVTSVYDGQQALDALGDQTFDVVLMDLEMPVMDGTEATAAIRRRDAELGLHTPIVAMTAHALAGIEQQCHSAGMDACLTKPIDSKRLFDVLEEMAQKFSSPAAVG